MAALPKPVSEAWDKRKGPAVFTTVAKDGTPNSIWVGCLEKYDEERLIVADNYFHKTRSNILDGSKGSLLWITDEGGSYQAKGRIEYVTEGPMFDRMRECFDEKLPRVAAAVLHVEEVYSGAEKLL
jgi:predicted pyridoxine 5'-phosphate oxidase superfamily flavin-nucleotide-binding protein